VKKTARLILALASSCLMVGNAQADLDDGLVAHYPFCGNANDESGNENHGTVNGATLTDDRFTNPNGAYHFDGNNAHIQSLISVNLAQGMSYSAWVLVQGQENSHANLISINGRSFSFFQYRSNEIELCLGNCLGHHFSTFQENQWQHFVVTLNDDGVAQVFLNSELIKTLNPSSFPNLNNVSLHLGGESGTGYNLTGKMDDVRIYNRPLSESEINSLYTSEDECSSPMLVVTLANFTATPFQNDIRIHWKTASEVNNAGFHIWRATGEGWKEGDYSQAIRVTDQLIPSKGTKVGGYPYSYVDSNVESGITYYYGLEDIDFNGQSTVHWDFIDEITAK